MAAAGNNVCEVSALMHGAIILQEGFSANEGKATGFPRPDFRTWTS
jgi:hypothetical protein